MTSELNPGSDSAVEMGCKCPVLDNGRGAGYLGGVRDEDGELLFVINGNCPLHALKGQQHDK